MKVGRVIFGVLGFLIGIAAVSGSLAILLDERDADDFFISKEQSITQESYAVISEDVAVFTDTPGWLADWLVDPVDIRIKGSAASGAIFLGIAETADLNAYLAGVGHDEVTSIDFNGDDIRYTAHPGTAVPAPPATQDIWVVQATGPGEQTLDWSLETGNYAVAVMNADATAGVDATLVLGAKISNFVLLAWVGLAFGVLSMLGGIWLIYRGAGSTGTPRVIDLRQEPIPVPPTPEKPTVRT